MSDLNAGTFEYARSAFEFKKLLIIDSINKISQQKIIFYFLIFFFKNKLIKKIILILFTINKTKQILCFIYLKILIINSINKLIYFT